ncbi:MAG: adenine phosphoribosyltransferase, partial [Bacteroidaceae bacterium]|nr:adenine phosphoribosyltransferase [Bacteroidaceae bacterium]
NLRSIPDFPIPGILFRDVTTLFKSYECLKEIEDTLYEMYKDRGITKVVGVESRGFVMGALLASRLNAGFVLARKPGKLPAETIQETFAKEYGTDTIEIHKDAINEKDVVLIHDDLLATGGTVKAAYNLVQKFNPQKTFINFIIEITNLDGRKVFDEKVDIKALIEVEE